MTETLSNEGNFILLKSDKGTIEVKRKVEDAGSEERKSFHYRVKDDEKTLFILELKNYGPVQTAMEKRRKFQKRWMAELLPVSYCCEELVALYYPAGALASELKCSLCKNVFSSLSTVYASGAKRIILIHSKYSGEGTFDFVFSKPVKDLEALLDEKGYNPLESILVAKDLIEELENFALDQLEELFL